MRAVGYRTGLIHDETRLNWDGTGPRPIYWSAWYPSFGTAATCRNFFDLGALVVNGPLREKGPVVLMSHGTGGTAEGLGWLARRLASAGAIVLAANHHGNTGADKARPEGFLAWSERPADLSHLLTWHLGTGPFASALHGVRIAALGYSLGSHSTLALTGARTRFDLFDQWRLRQPDPTSGPPEMPDAIHAFDDLMAKSTPFQAAWQRLGDDYTDPRIQAIVAIAPAPPVRGFIPSSVASIKLPVTLLSGGADVEAPTSECADWLSSQNPAFRHVIVGKDVGHYSFLGHPSDQSHVGKSFLFTDPPSVSRDDVHARTGQLVLDAFGLAAPV